MTLEVSCTDEGRMDGQQRSALVKGFCPPRTWLRSLPLCGLLAACPAAIPAIKGRDGGVETASSVTQHPSSVIPFLHVKLFENCLLGFYVTGKFCKNQL